MSFRPTLANWLLPVWARVGLLQFALPTSCVTQLPGLAVLDAVTPALTVTLRVALQGPVIPFESVARTRQQ
ncbi:hypothetical protein D3C83_233780 [compost metagenome]